MTESEWNNAADPKLLLEYLWGCRPVSPRRVRLYACASCRRVWRLFVNETSRKAVEDAEQFADGLLEPANRKRSYQCAEWVWVSFQDSYRSSLPDPDDDYENFIQKIGLHRRGVAAAAGAAACAVGEMEGNTSVKIAPGWVVEAAGWATVPDGTECKDGKAEICERAAQADLLRHIFGNPFRALALPTQWPSAIHGLAEAVYRGENVAFALHDALAECGFAAFAEHFRMPEHPKGCAWLDVILGKT